MKKNSNILIFIISIVALLISIVAILISYRQISPLRFDYIEILVGALSLLVTALVGWNIYASIDIKEMRKQIAKERTFMYCESENNLTQTYLGLSDYYYSLLVKSEQTVDERLYKYIFFRISCILHASKINDFKTCEVVAKVLLETIHPENIEMSASNKKNLFDLLSFVNSPREVPHFSELLHCVALIRVANSASNDRTSRP